MPKLLIALLLATNAFAAGRQLAPRPLIPTRDSFRNLAIGRASDQFLAVWNAGSLYGMVVDAGGHRVTPMAFLLAETGSVDDVQVVGTGSSYAVFWIDRESRTHLTDVALNGQVLGTRTLELPKTIRIRAAWDGERFLAVLYGEAFRPNASIAVLLDRDGAILHEIPFARELITAHVAITDGDFFTFTATTHNTFVHRITSGGQATQVQTGDFPKAIASVPLDDDTLLMVTATSDGTMRSVVLKNGIQGTEQVLATQHLGGIAPIQLLRGEGRHLLVFMREGIETMHLADDGTPLSEPKVAVTTRSSAVAASNDEVMLVTHVADGLVKSLTFDVDGTIVAEDPLSIRPAEQSHALIGAGGGSMLAAWNEAIATPLQTRIRTAVVNRDFASENVRELVPNGRLAAKTIAWNGTEHLIVYESELALYAARVSYDGNPIGEPARIGSTALALASVTWAGDRWAIAWVDYEHAAVQYATLSRSGFASPPRSLQLAGNESAVIEVALAFDGSRVHLAWVETTLYPPPFRPRPTSVFTTRLRRDGRVVDATPLAIPGTRPDDLAIAANSDRVVLLAHDENQTTMHVLSAKARELLSTRTLREVGEAIVESDVTWNGYEFFAAAYAERTLTVWRLGRDAADIDDVRSTETLARSDWRVSIAASPSYDAVVALDETDAAFGPRAVIYPAREMR